MQCPAETTYSILLHVNTGHLKLLKLIAAPKLNMDSHTEKAKTITGDVASEVNLPSVPSPDRQLEKQVLRHLDRRLAPMFATLYFIAYLDRSNIGNAAVAGLVDDLSLSGSQFSTAVSVFFATYVTFEMPAVLAMKKVQPHRLLSAMALGWSVVTIGTAFVTSYRELIAVRLLLGLAEAGFFPCLSLYITMVYKREEQVRSLRLHRGIQLILMWM